MLFSSLVSTIIYPLSPLGVIKWLYSLSISTSISFVKTGVINCFSISISTLLSTTKSPPKGYEQPVNNKIVANSKYFIINRL